MGPPESSTRPANLGAPLIQYPFLALVIFSNLCS